LVMRQLPCALSVSRATAVCIGVSDETRVLCW